MSNEARVGSIVPAVPLEVGSQATASNKINPTSFISPDIISLAVPELRPEVHYPGSLDRMLFLRLDNTEVVK